jgi:hypothetical protein
MSLPLSFARSLARILCLFLLAFGATAAFSQAAAESPIEAFYLAKDDGQGYAGEAADSFMTTDVPIHCVIELKPTDDATVKMNFVAVNVPGVKAGSRIVSSSYTTKDGENIVRFRGAPPERWTAGTYRLDIFVREKLAVSREFPIVQKPTPASQMRFVEGKPIVNESRKPKPRPRT